MKSRLFIVFVLIVIFTIHCNRDKSPTSPNLDVFIYPTAIGNEWQYERIFYHNAIQNDSTNSSTSDTSSATSVIKIVGQVVLQDSISTFQFNETLTEDDNSYSSETFYANQNDGFYRQGYRGAGYCIPKNIAAHKILYKGYVFNNVREMTDFFIESIPLMKSSTDSLIIENPPLKLLPYPLKVGMQWTIMILENRWRIDKKIVAKETVTVPAGKFGCYKIRYYQDFDGDNQWDKDFIAYDYISPQGLVKRTAQFLNASIVDETGQIIGEFDSGEEIKLTHVKLK